MQCARGLQPEGRIRFRRQVNGTWMSDCGSILLSPTKYRGGAGWQVSGHWHGRAHATMTDAFRALDQAIARAIGEAFSWA